MPVQLTPKQKKLLSLLSDSLSEKEIEQVLAGALLGLTQRGRERLIGRLGEDTGGSLERVLEALASERTSRRAPAGKEKVLQEWERAWSDWTSLVLETGNEDGRYVVQDEPWDAPYFDAPAFFMDLEKVAARLRKVLPPVLARDLDPDFSFAEALRETVDDIGSGLPEWIEPDWDGYCAEYEVTRCLLEWEWGAASRASSEDSAFAFADGVRKLEHSTHGLMLDPGAVAQFLLGLDERDQRRILEGIWAERKAERWKSAIESPFSSWFGICQELARRWNSKLHLEICRANTSRDWRLAVPVVVELVRKKQDEEAIVLIEEAFRTLLGPRRSTSWDPCKTLLVGEAAAHRDIEKETPVVHLLELWSRAAARAGLGELAWALDLQAALCRHWRNWDRALAAFQRESAARPEAVRGRLLSQWTELVAREALGERGASSWIPLLMHAVCAPRRSASSFQRSLREWIGRAAANPRSFRAARPALELLTLDLDSGARLRSLSPGLWRCLSRAADPPDALLRSRRKWLKALGGPRLFPEVAAAWKRQAACLAPDPAAATGSDYRACVAWLQIIRELDAAASKKILGDWSEGHRRRRNLWQALAAAGLVPKAGDARR